MKLIGAFALVILIGLQVFAQDTGAATQTAPADEAAKLADHKDGTTIIGCLSGPDTNSKYTLRSMTYRTGVEVFGPVDLKTDSGSKVKLTGSWRPGDQPKVKGQETRKFRATQVEVLEQKCEAPSEKTPVSKQKQQRQQQKQKSSANPPASGDTTNPK
jgi:hypothetical protein